MNTDLNKTTLRMAIVWGVLFSVNGLCSCILVGLSNSVWSTMSTQGKFLLFVGILMNWTGLMMAFVSKTVARLEVGKLPPTNGTDIFTKTQTEIPPIIPVQQAPT